MVGGMVYDLVPAVKKVKKWEVAVKWRTYNKIKQAPLLVERTLR